MQKQILVTGFSLLSVLFPLGASAASFTGMYVFGDSLSDIGNVYNSTGGFPPFPYDDGRFSNGPVWVETLGTQLGLNPAALTDPLSGNPAQGINYAFGGATTGTENTINPLLPAPLLPGLQQQIGTFAATTPVVDQNALYVVWAGANDYLGGGITNTKKPVNNLKDSIQSLYGLGARNFMVLNLPDLGSTPTGVMNGQTTVLNERTAKHNSRLQNALNTLDQSFADINLYNVNVNSLFRDAVDNPAQYGFANVTDPCVDLENPSNPNNLLCGLAPESVQNSFLFWDTLHPTAAGHQIVAQYAYNSLTNPTPMQTVPEPSVAGSLLVLGFGWVARSQLKKKAS